MFPLLTLDKTKEVNFKLYKDSDVGLDELIKL
jgi:hypothetical protein